MDPHGWVLASDFCLGGKHMGSFIYSQRMKMSSSNLFLLPPKPTLSLGTSWPTPKVMSLNVTEVSIVYFSTFLCIPECLVARFWAMRWKLKFVEGGGGRWGALWNCWLSWYKSQEREMWLVSSLPYLRRLDFLLNSSWEGFLNNLPTYAAPRNIR